MLQHGRDRQQVLDYMTARYGDFVLYRPPFRASTALLWVGPGLLLVLAGGMLFSTLRRRQAMSADLFEPEESDDAQRDPA
jgi:cytochrome c-type biogenesis protein CcmH